MSEPVRAALGQVHIRELCDAEFALSKRSRRPLVVTSDDAPARDALLQDLLARANRRCWLVSRVQVAGSESFGQAHADAFERLITQLPRRALRTKRRLRRAVQRLGVDLYRWGPSANPSRVLAEINAAAEARKAGIVLAYPDLDNADESAFWELWPLVNAATSEMILIVGSCDLPRLMTDAQQSFERCRFESLESPRQVR